MKLRLDADAEARHARHLRRLNLERLLAVAMERVEPFTRAELIHATSLSAPTVGALTSELIRGDLIRELGTGPSRGGRRPSLMEFNAQHGYVVGTVVGPMKTELALADLRGDRLAHRVEATTADAGPERLLSRLAGWIRSLLKEARVPLEKLVTVVAGAPGAVDSERGVVVALTPNLDGWSQVPMGESLERALGSPVVVENDVNLAVLGERWRGAARGHDTCAFLSVGIGIGAGIVIDGELHRGQHFLAGEIALMCMGPQYVDQDFGPRGCLETLAGLKSLLSTWRGGKVGRLDGGIAELFAAAESGDHRAQRAIEDAARLIAIAATNLSLVLDPSLLVFGGALINQGPPLVDEIRRMVARIIPAPPEIVPSTLGEEAALWGSLLLATTEARGRLRRRLRDPHAA